MFLYQNEEGYLFNSDTHFLYDFITNFNPKGEVLDVGCGCGILGLLTKRDYDISLTSIDIQKQNIFLTQKNAQINGLDATIIYDDFLSYNFEKKFDYIISNPPYYHDGVSKSKNKSINISRYEMHLPIKKFIYKTKRIIQNRGHFIFCYDAKLIDEIFFYLKEAKLQIEDLKFVHGKPDKPSSLVLIHCRNSSKSKVKIHPPLFNIVDKHPTKDVKSIYQKTRTYSIKCKLS